MADQVFATGNTCRERERDDLAASLVSSSSSSSAVTHHQATAAASVTTSTATANADAKVQSTRKSSLISRVSVGSYLHIYWPLDDTHYVAKVVGERGGLITNNAHSSSSSSSSSSDVDVDNNGIFTVVYSDGTVETLNLRLEKFRLLDERSHADVIRRFAEENAALGTATTNTASVGDRTGCVVAGTSSLAQIVAGASPAGGFAQSCVADNDSSTMAQGNQGNQHPTQQSDQKHLGSLYDANRPKYTATSDELSDDICLNVMSFIYRLVDLAAFGRTCRRIHRLWSNPAYFERLLQKMFFSQFGKDALRNSGYFLAGRNMHQYFYWKQTWIDMKRLRLALSLQRKPLLSADGFNHRTKEHACQLIRVFTTGEDDDEGPQTQKESSSSSATSESLSSTSGTALPSKRKRKLIEQSGDARVMRKTIGVLSEREEIEAIYYDNPSYAPASELRYCFGYFGFLALPVPGLSNEEIPNGPPVAVWGDLLGVRIFDSLSDMLYHREDDKSLSSTKDIASDADVAALTDSHGRLCTALADKDGEGLVLTALASPFIAQQITGEEACPCIFLGMSSGIVISIGIKQVGRTGKYSYEILSAEEAHESEVTSLAILNNPFIEESDSPESFMLASSSVDGFVKMYANAFRSEKKYRYSLAHADDVLPKEIFSFDNESPVFSIASTVVVGRNAQNKALLIATGNQDGSIGLWAKELRKHNINGPFERVRIIKIQNAAGPIITSRMSFIHDSKALVTGSNHGDVRVWSLRVEDAPKTGPLNTLYYHLGGYIHMDIRHRMSKAHVGTIESIETFGNVLLTSGGFDGLVKGWCLTTGRLLGAVKCHRGRHTAGTLTLKKPIMSAVVGSLFYNKSVVSLCRDGSINKWNYDAIVEDHLSRQDISNGTTKEADEIDEFLSFIRPAVSKSNVKLPSNRKVRSMTDLKHVMSMKGRSSADLQQTMRVGIFKASVALALQPGHKDAPFIGADGRPYESTKKAFAKYSGLVACASCRGNGQGAFFCRLVRAHELPASSLAQVRGLLVGQRSEQKKKSKRLSSPRAEDPPSVLESIPTEESGCDEEEEGTGSQPWQCHQCALENEATRKNCSSCWASRKKIRQA